MGEGYTEGPPHITSEYRFLIEILDDIASLVHTATSWTQLGVGAVSCRALIWRVDVRV
jgi:hypothetical protein